MATKKRIGLLHNHRVWLCSRRGREHSFGSNDIYFGTADKGILFCPNEQYMPRLTPIGSVRERALRNFPVLGVPQRWPISDVGVYYLLIGRLSVISIGHTQAQYSRQPRVSGFLVYVSGSR